MNRFVEVAIERTKEILVEVGLPILEEKAGDFIDNTVSQTKDFVLSIKTASKAQMHVIETAFLDLDGLKEVARTYKANGSKEVAASKKVVNNQYVVYLAYTADKELLPVENNQYVVIRCKALAPDVLDLFGSDNYIVLM